VLFAGDAFNKHSPNAVMLNEYTKRIYRLSRYCPVVLLVGNHDVPYANAEKVSSLAVYNALNLDNIIIGNKFEVLDIDTKGGPLQVATFPYPSRQIFKSQKDISNKLKELEELIDDKSPAILLGHFGVQGAAIQSGLASYHINDEAQLDMSWLKRGPWDYVALGHIHNYQILHDSPPVIYPGSIDRVDFGEEFDDKGFVWVDISKKSLSHYFVSVNPRPMVTLNYSFDNTSRHMTRKIVDDIESRDLKDSLVRVRISAPEKLSDMIRTAEIYDALKGSYYIHSLSINRIRDLPESRLGDVGVPLSSLPSLDLIDRYFTSVSKLVGKEKRELLKLAADIVQEVDNE
jgi:exonuclease SbcD